MTVLNFPQSPSLGEYYPENGVLYQWDGDKWTANLNNSITNPSDYVLPAATAAVLGGVKVGARLTVLDDGTLSADVQGGGTTVGSLQEVTDEGNTTDNLIEAAGGVKVTGGIAAEVEDGIGKKADNQLNIYRANVEVASFGVNFGGGYHSIRADGISNNDLAKNCNLFFASTSSISNVSNGASSVNAYTAQLGPSTGLGNTVNTFGFKVTGSQNTSASGLINYGFFSELGNNLDEGKSNYNFYSAGTAPNYFAGITEHESGVKVTGGGPDIQVGLTGRPGADGSIRLVADSTSVLAINANGNYGFPTASTNALFNVSGSHTFTGETDVNYARFTGTITLPETGSSLIGVQVNPAIVAGGRLVNYTGVAAQTPASLANTGTYIGFRAFDIATRQNNQSYGFYSSINNATNTGAQNYNFYAEGNAPNYFTGDTHIGGTATRNTYELWESTLTEEQQEQLAAGTLAIPANVSTPGDGSFVRQWWYDRQSAEDQALIDSGELEYPEHLQAANFTDTFALGDSTFIDLLANGNARFNNSNRKNACIEIDTGVNSLEKTLTVRRDGVPTVNPALIVAGKDSDDDSYKTSASIDYKGNIITKTGGVYWDVEDSDFPSDTSNPNLQFRFNGDIQATVNTLGRFDSKMDKKKQADSVIGFQTTGDVPTTSGDTGVTCYRADAGLATGHTTPTYSGFFANASEAQKGSAVTASGLRVDGYTDVATTNYGVYVSVANGANTNYTFYGNGTAPSYFAGSVESNGGYAVTGGVYDATKPTIASNGNNLIFNTLASSMAFRREDNKIFGVGVTSSNDTIGINFLPKEFTSLALEDDKSLHALNINVDQGDYSNISTLRGNSFQFPRANGVTVDPSAEIIGFHSYPATTTNENDTGITYYGFKSDLGRSQNYNFYAGNSAPNFFAGAVYCNAGALNNRQMINSGVALFLASNSNNVGSGPLQIVGLNNPTQRAMVTFTTTPDSGASATGSTVGSIVVQANGAGTNFNETSDYRLKSNIQPLASAADRVNQLKPCSFDIYGTNRTGFIAHEVQEIEPVAVTGAKDATEAIGTLVDYNGTVLETEVTEPDELTYTEETTDENEVTTTVTRTRTWTATGTRPIYQALDQSKLIPLLTKALQEALERIEVLEAAVNS